jgi:hypothetical protein
MSGETDRPSLPRTVLILEFLIRRLNLGAVPPFTFNAGLAVFAVAGGLLSPGWLGSVAGSLLAMQALVTVSFCFLFMLLFLRHLISKQRHAAAGRGDLTGWTWLFDYLAVFFLIASILVGGILGPLEFIILTGTIYIGVGRGTEDARVFAEFGAGVAVAAVTLIVVAVLFRLPEQFEHWAGARGSVGAAGCYFALMAAVEAGGAFPRIVRGFSALAAIAKRET